MKKMLLCLVLALCCLVMGALADQALTPTDTDLPEAKAVEIAKAEFQKRFGLSDEQMTWFSWDAALWDGDYFHEIADETQTPQRVWDVYFSYNRPENTVYHDSAADYLCQSIYMDAQTGAFVQDDLPTDDIFAQRLTAFLANLSSEAYMTSRDKAFQAARDQLQDESGMTDAEMPGLTASLYLGEPGKGDGPRADLDYSKAVWYVYFQNYSAFVALQVRADTYEVTGGEGYAEQLAWMVSSVQADREAQETAEKQQEAIARWEAEKGSVTGWSYQDKAAFYTENGFAFDAYGAFGASWLLPENGDIGYDAALKAAKDALMAHAGANEAELDGLDVSAAFGQAGEWGNSWSFEFRTPGVEENATVYSAYVAADGTAYSAAKYAWQEGESAPAWYLSLDGEESTYDGSAGNG